MIRDHKEIVLEQFNGLYRRGDPENTPPNYFTDCENIQYIGTSGFDTRDGIEVAQNIVGPLGNIIRAFNYITQTQNTLLVLIAGGDIYHITNNYQTVLGPILSIPEMTDFNFVPWAGRAYITPFTSYGLVPNRSERGLEDDFLYVYLGDGTPARPAAGNPPTAGSLVISNGAGNTDAGFHLFGVLYETDTGFQTAPARFTGFTTSASNGVSFAGIPVSPDSFVVARQLVMTKVIQNYNGDVTGYQYFLIPDGRIADNTSTTVSNITVFDADLLEDASHLIDNFAEIPAGVNLTIYHGRLCLCATFDDISIVLVSAQGEPEAISQLDGLLIAPLDGNPLTNMQELRDVLYGFKKNRTISWVDNGDVPSSWPLSVIDFGLGCPVHGIATVVDSGSANIDFLIIASFRGIVIFNGRYADPELSWVITDLWFEMDNEEFRKIQFANDTVHKILYMVMPDGRLLYSNYSNGLDPKKVRWCPWKFFINVDTICLVNISQLVIGSSRGFIS